MNEKERQYIAEQMYEMELDGIVDPETSELLQEEYGGWLAEIFDL